LYALNDRHPELTAAFVLWVIMTGIPVTARR